MKCLVQGNPEGWDGLAVTGCRHRHRSRNVIGMGRDQQMARDRCVRDKRRVRALYHDDGAGGAHGFQQQGIARRPAELRRAGMVEAMIEADREGSGFMRAGQ